MSEKTILPLLPLRGFVILPSMIINFDVGRKKSIQAIEHAMINDQLILLGVQKDANIDEPEEEDIYEVGTIACIKQILKLPQGTIRVLVEGVERAKITKYVEKEDFYIVETEKQEKTEVDEVEQEALYRTVEEVVGKFADVNKNIAEDTIESILSIKEPGDLADSIASNLQISFENRVKILNKLDPMQRIKDLIVILRSEVEISEVQKEIQKQVKENINKNQREYYLKEQLKVIQDALGEKEGIKGEVEEYRKKLEKINPPKYVVEKLEKELDRMQKIPSASSEAVVVRNYIEWVLDLPWNKYTEERIDMKEAEKILDEEHYGLEKVKERILEFLSVRQLAPKANSPILCLVGPPGVGKTSIARSIADAINRKYVRISLGGVRDESEIRGHRKTYVGSMPGRIIQALKQAKTSNPLILLDEIDKMSKDYRGNPTAALLEVLDAEQNNEFRDHYLELPYDLSDTLFLATANTLQTIPKPLLDRLEILQLSSYTEDEKFHITKNHLINKQLEKHGLKEGQVKISDEALSNVINYYTKEAGVRNLERKIGDICRKCARQLFTEEKEFIRVTMNNLEKYLGIPRYRSEKIIEKADIGIARGLAWTPYGGDTLSIEVNTMKGSGKFELTGQLGDVMKESAKAAISYIRSKQNELNISDQFYKETDIHIHIPEGAVPKDGPSAGITMATAMISALTEREVRNDIGMTGEVTLRGRVLPIGGLKEKILAAKRAGIVKVLVPEENKKDISEINKEVLKNIEIVFVNNMDQVLKEAII